MNFRADVVGHADLPLESDQLNQDLAAQLGLLRIGQNQIRLLDVLEFQRGLGGFHDSAQGSQASALENTGQQFDAPVGSVGVIQI